jgi:ABC-2 type transport system permease protein
MLLDRPSLVTHHVSRITCHASRVTEESGVRLYLEVARRSFRRQMAYRAATLAGLTTNSFWGALRSFAFIGFYSGRGPEAGWTLDDALTYVWLTQALIMPVYLWGWWEISTTIRTGDVVSDLSKPFDYHLFWLSQDAGRALFHLLFRFAPTLAIGLLLFRVHLPLDAGRWALFGLSLTLAIAVSFGLRFILNMAAFWLLDHRGVGAMVTLVGNLFSGMLIPLAFFPDWLRGVALWLPFAAMIQAPVDVLLGKAAGPALAAVLGLQLAWALGLAAIGRRLLALGERKLVIQGG